MVTADSKLERSCEAGYLNNPFVLGLIVLVAVGGAGLYRIWRPASAASLQLADRVRLVGGGIAFLILAVLWALREFG